MYLISTETHRIEEKHGEAIPEYAILSHTWEEGQEISYRDYVEGRQRDTIGYEKIMKCCELARERGLRWAWCDTCCIDKSSSAELSEAINSMFSWYQRASVCFVFLQDMERLEDGAVGNLAACKWFQRGWTLQELLASRDCSFHDRNFDFIGTKTTLSSALSRITKIPKDYLLVPQSFLSASVAQRLSWMHARTTSRAEDLAYCLLGLFNVNMPLLYGEGGPQAFFRLQREILAQIDDDSIFSWIATSPSPSHEKDVNVDKSNASSSSFHFPAPPLSQHNADADFRSPSFHSRLVAQSLSASPGRGWLADHTLPHAEQLRGLLARSPEEFARCGHVRAKSSRLTRPPSTMGGKRTIALRWMAASWVELLCELTSWPLTLPLPGGHGRSRCVVALNCVELGAGAGNRSRTVVVGLKREHGRWYRRFPTSRILGAEEGAKLGRVVFALSLLHSKAVLVEQDAQIQAEERRMTLREKMMRVLIILGVWVTMRVLPFSLLTTAAVMVRGYLEIAWAGFVISLVWPLESKLYLFLFLAIVTILHFVY